MNQKYQKKDIYPQKKDSKFLMNVDQCNNIIMEYQNIVNLLYNQTTQPSKFRTKNWVEINDYSRGIYNTNSQIKFKTSMLKSSLCDYSDAYIFDKRRITITGAGVDAAERQADERSKGVIFKNYALFTNCIIEINNCAPFTNCKS